MNRVINFIAYLIVIIFIFASIDVFIFHEKMNLGAQRYKSNLNNTFIMADYPYAEFISSEIAQTEPFSTYYTGKKIYEGNENKIKIAFFGGSTAAYNDPNKEDSLNIPQYVEQILQNKLKKGVVVINYSCGAANHRQHLHMLLEFLPKFKPDIVVYYGGNNETVQAFGDDPRYNYPFNYFYKHEFPTWKKALIEYSAIGSIIMTQLESVNLNSAKKRSHWMTDEWMNGMVNNYFDTLELSKTVTNTFNSNLFGKTQFIAIFQPLNLPNYQKYAEKPVSEIRKRLPSINYAYDFYNKYDGLNDIFYDACHVKDEANRLMANEISDLLIDKYLKKYKK